MAKTKNIETQLPTSDQVEKFEMLYPMVSSCLNEIRELSKKKPDEPLNKFKVWTINKRLEQVKLILSNEPTFEFLELLDEETLPSNSDAGLLISQFIAMMEYFKSKYHTKDGLDLDLNEERFSWKTRR